ERALPPERVSRISLRGIERDGAAEVIAERVGGRWSPASLERVWAAAAGNPLAVVEIARELRRRSDAIAPDVPLPLPASLADALRDRVSRLSAPARAACEAAVILQRASPREIATLGDGGLDDAIGAEVLGLDGGAVSFTHPLLRVTIDEAMGPSRRT